ncbi:MAG: hypothetical protein JSU08_10265 [Acidobacteria bacterium]|nr:hypothetical protein [Acidobacteriota bacterium]
MRRIRIAALSAVFAVLAGAACSRTPTALPESGPLSATSEKVTVEGHYQPVQIDAVESMSIDDGKLVLHGHDAKVAVDLPANADPTQKGRGWALVTEGEGEQARTFTFTHEMTLEDFTVSVPNVSGQLAYGSLGGRDGKDVLLFAYGGGPKAYWGWANIEKKR